MRHRVLALAIAACLSGAAGAQDGSSQGGASQDGTSASGPAQDGTATETLFASSGPIRVERLATLEYPWGLAVLPDGRVLVTEKAGRLRIWAEGRLSAPLEGVPEVARHGPRDQGGLMDVAIDPDFATNRRVYLSFSEAATPQPAKATNPPDRRYGDAIDPSDTLVRGGAVARATLDGERLTDLRVIWRQVPKTAGRGHFGNRIVFGPDRMLYVTSGDRMRFEPAQRLDANLGKIVRIAPDGSVPKDNPFAGRSGARGDLWSIGHRNVLAAAFEPRTGRLWAFEMGPRGGDELNRVRAGANHGWPVVSDGEHYDGTPIPDHGQRAGFDAPMKTWTPVISPSGALFYDGAAFPAWRGDALVGSLSDRSIVRLRTDGTRLLDEERIALRQRVRDLAQAPDGTLLVLVDEAEGALLRLSPAR
jgi:glucose/arabinose dehydrogenase